MVEAGSTTPVCPVFDASAKARPTPSLNECLQKGQNLIELVKAILLRFREGKIGVTADVRKAFLQIGMCVDERNFLRFLWFDRSGKVVSYRHFRLVFGLTCSPFILAVIINSHLEAIVNLLKRGESEYSFLIENIVKLQNSFYEDNSVASVDSIQSLQSFIGVARNAMMSAGFDLQGWEYNGDCFDESESGLLGIKWNKNSDKLSLNGELVREIDCARVTKRSILSGANRIFDPLGFACPVTLAPRLLLQETWSKKFGWDDAMDEGIRERFVKWAESLGSLGDMQISRCFSPDFFAEDATVSLHTFCDASKLAYAAVSFLHVKRGGVARLSFVLNQG